MGSTFTAAPFRSGWKNPLRIPPARCSGIRWPRMSPGPSASRSPVARAVASTWAWPWGTSFGRPVVPDVAPRQAHSLRARVANSSEAVGRARTRSKAPAPLSPEGSVVSSVRPSSRAARRTADSPWPGTTTAFGCSRTRRSRSVSKVAAGWSGVNVALAGSVARATAVWARSPLAQATMSPRPMPQPASRAATRATCSPRPANASGVAPAARIAGASGVSCASASTRAVTSLAAAGIMRIEGVRQRQRAA